MREDCLRKGLSGIKGLGVLFRGMDKDYSKAVVLQVTLSACNVSLNIVAVLHEYVIFVIVKCIAKLHIFVAGVICLLWLAIFRNFKKEFTSMVSRCQMRS